MRFYLAEWIYFTTDYWANDAGEIPWQLRTHIDNTSSIYIKQTANVLYKLLNIIFHITQPNYLKTTYNNNSSIVFI